MSRKGAAARAAAADRFQRRAEERASRRRAVSPQPENPTPLIMRHLPCLVDPACPVDHLRRKRRPGAPPVLNRFSKEGDDRGRGL